MEISKEEMLEALSRSGYLLEAEIANELSNLGFFVETNLVIEDPLTRKSREVDIVAEYYDRDAPLHDLECKAKIEYAFEVKNNSFPLVLLNEFNFTPRVEDWVGLKEIITIPQDLKYDQYENFYKELIEKKRGCIFSQYCSFHKKKQNDELMALHPDNIHSGLAKIIQYCDESVDRWAQDIGIENEHNERYLRHFLYMPVLLIQDDLYELKNENLVKVDSSILVTNYHQKQEPSMAYVFIVTRKGFTRFINESIDLERRIDEKLVNLRRHNA